MDARWPRAAPLSDAGRRADSSLGSGARVEARCCVAVPRRALAGSLAHAEVEERFWHALHRGEAEPPHGSSNDWATPLPWPDINAQLLKGGCRFV
jgi:hypothetical protein